MVHESVTDYSSDGFAYGVVRDETKEGVDPSDSSLISSVMKTGVLQGFCKYFDARGCYVGVGPGVIALSIGDGRSLRCEDVLKADFFFDCPFFRYFPYFLDVASKDDEQFEAHVEGVDEACLYEASLRRII